MDIRAVRHNPPAGISELKWCDYKNSHADTINMLLKTNRAGLSLTVMWSNDKKLLAELQAWQESWTLREDYLYGIFCVTSQCTVEISKKGGCGGRGHAEKVILWDQTHKITNTWHASQTTGPLVGFQGCTGTGGINS